MGNIIIHSDFGKKLLELTEDELIIKRFLHRKKIKRSDIRSAYLLDSSLNILTYDNKVIVANYAFIKWSEKDDIKRIIDEINKEDVIFNLNQDNSPFMVTFVWWFNPLINILGDWNEINYFHWIVFISMTILLFWIYLERKRNRGINYYVDKKEFRAVKGKGKSIKYYSNQDIRLVKEHDTISKYKVKNEKITFELVKKIDYPLSYKFALDEIRKLTEKVV